MFSRGMSVQRGGYASRLTTGANSAPVQSASAFGSKPENQPNNTGNYGDSQPGQFNQKTETSGANVRGTPFRNNARGTSGANVRGTSARIFPSAMTGANAAPVQGSDANVENQGGFPTRKFGENAEQKTGGFGTKFGSNFEKDPPRADEKKESSALPGRSDYSTQIGYVPKDREIDDIQKEDDLAKGLYSMVFETDTNVLVTGAGSDIAIVNSWKDAKLDAKVMENIMRSGYIHPRKIQSYSIPLIVEGYDLKAQAETGSGKSAAFLIPLINKIIDDKQKNPITGVNNKPFAIIMEPTRELALQLYDQARKIALNTGVRVVKAYGQYQVTANGKEIMEGSDIVIGTPGRLCQFICDGTISPANLRCFVLDEADRLISDVDFIGIVQKIRGLSTYPKKEDVQNLFFSATFPEEVENLANDLLKSKRAFVHNELMVAVNSKITQEFIECPENEKKSKVLDILESDLKKARDTDPNAKQPRTLIFVQKRSDADLVSLFLCDSGIRATTINGDRPQKEREKALEYFRSNETPVLVATDVCARGLDIKDLDWVINMDLPGSIETYVHRVGRTGRLKAGRALSFFDDLADRSLSAPLVRLLKESNFVSIPEFLTAAASKPPHDSTSGNEPKIGGFGQKTEGFGNGIPGFGQKNSGFEQKIDSFGSENTGFGPKAPGFEQKIDSFGSGNPGFDNRASGNEQTESNTGSSVFGQKAGGFSARGSGNEQTESKTSASVFGPTNSGFSARGSGNEQTESKTSASVFGQNAGGFGGQQKAGGFSARTSGNEQTESNTGSSVFGQKAGGFSARTSGN